MPALGAQTGEPVSLVETFAAVAASRSAALFVGRTQSGIVPHRA